jgi:2-polyprenyl-3-methyl-5-hydroxy-6-metoxy-1,4-benzoquinol methylase
VAKNGKSLLTIDEVFMTGLLSSYLRQRRFKTAIPYIKGDILDLGCGYTDLIPRLELEQAYVGIDKLEPLIKWLYDRYPEYEFHKRDLDSQDIEVDRKFDTILMLAIVEHLQNPERVLSQIPQYLQKDGCMIITTPPPFGDHIHRIGARFGLFYQSAVEEHNIIFKRNTLEPILSRCNLQVDVYRKFLLGGNQLFVCSQISIDPMEKNQSK